MEDLIFKFILLALIVCIFAFNDQKNLLYVVKVLYILIMGTSIIFKNIKIRWYVIWSFLFTAFSFSSILWAWNANNVVYQFIWMLQAILVFVVTIPSINTYERLDYFYRSLILASIVLAIRLILITPVNTWGSGRIGFAINYNPNVVGMQMTFATVSCLYFIQRSKYKIPLIIAILAFISIILFSGSRKSLIGLVIGVSVYTLLQLGREKKIGRRLVFIPLTLFIVYIFYYLIHNVEYFYNVIGYRIDILIGVFQGNNDNIRLHMISEGIELFKNRPFFGYGIGSYSTISGFGMYSHNNYIEMLVNLGLVGFLIYYSLYFNIAFKLYNIYRLKDPRVSIFIAILAVIFFLEIGVVSYRDLYILLPLASAYSYILIFYENRKKGRCYSETISKRNNQIITR